MSKATKCSHSNSHIAKCCRACLLEVYLTQDKLKETLARIHEKGAKERTQLGNEVLMLKSKLDIAEGALLQIRFNLKNRKRGVNKSCFFTAVHALTQLQV